MFLPSVDETSSLLEPQDSAAETPSNDTNGGRSSITHSHDHHNDDDHHHFASARHISEKVPLYAKPQQRQRWDETQVLPHVNWGDLYFDLFYVAAAYNLSHSFKDSPTLEGLLYFFCTYFPTLQIWNEKLFLDGRYCYEDNLFHRSWEVLHLCILGTGIWHIQPTYVMRNTKSNPTMLIFVASLMADAALYSYLYIDVYLNVNGGSEARSNAWLEAKRKIMRTLIYAIAFAIAAKDYLLESYRDGTTTSLSSSSMMMEANHWPAFIIVFEFLFEFVAYTLFEVFVYIPKTGRSHKEFYVPINLEFVIHRIGEWVMLMLGESVLSILTSKGTDSWQYSVSFYCGLLTITMFQYLFFRSQPSQAKDHAMRRSQAGGYIWTYMLTIYSASLILVGCSYKMMLSPAEIEVEENEEGEGGLPFDLNRRIAFIYATSQFTSFLTLDIMLLSHRGFRQNFERFFPFHGRRGKVIPWLVLACDLVLLCITLFGLNQIHDLTWLSITGCLLVFAQVVLRTMGMKYFPITVEAMERAIRLDCFPPIQDDRRWPNVTEPGHEAL